MKKDKQSILFERFNNLFNPHLPVSEDLMGFGFECNDGWFKLLYKLCLDIEQKLSKPENKSMKGIPNSKFKIIIGYLISIPKHRIKPSIKIIKYTIKLKVNKKYYYNKWLSMLEKIVNVWKIEYWRLWKVEPFRVVQVKEKFGSLRFYTNYTTDKISKIIDKAESDSYSICEECGLPSDPEIYHKGDGGWIYNRCSKCLESIK